MSLQTAPALTVSRGVVLYVGALLGPGLLVLPGLAAAKAGPASVLDWIALLILSALLAVVFAGLGVRHPSTDGVRGYTSAGLGQRAGTVVGWWFLAGIVTGAPTVCVIGGAYGADALGWGRWGAAGVAAGLLLLVLALTLGGVRASAAVQLGLVALLVVIVGVAVIGSAPHARASNWTPFAPHGWNALGPAGAELMLSFAGWEAVAGLTTRLRDPGRELPRVIGLAFGITAAIYLGLAALTIGALGRAAGAAAPIAELLSLSVGSVGRAVAAAAAVLLTLGTTNAYLSGAADLARSLTAPAGRPAGRDAAPPPRWLLLAILASGSVLIPLAAEFGTSVMVLMPSAFFLAVYLGCTASAAVLLEGGPRVAAGCAVVAVLTVLAFTAWALVAVVIVGAAAASLATPGTARQRRRRCRYSDRVGVRSRSVIASPTSHATRHSASTTAFTQTGGCAVQTSVPPTIADTISSAP